MSPISHLHLILPYRAYYNFGQFHLNDYYEYAIKLLRSLGYKKVPLHKVADIPEGTTYPQMYFLDIMYTLL